MNKTRIFSLFAGLLTLVFFVSLNACGFYKLEALGVSGELTHRAKSGNVVVTVKLLSGSSGSCMHRATGFVIDEERMYVVTTYDVLKRWDEGRNYTIEVVAGSKYKNVELVWKDKKTNLAVIKLGNKSWSSLSQVDVSFGGVVAGGKYIVSGNQGDDFCSKYEKPVRSVLVKVIMQGDGARTGSLQTKIYNVIHAIDNSVVFDDFYTKYVVTKAERTPVYSTYGVAGGPLLDKKGRVVAIATRITRTHFVCVLVDKVPKEFFGKQ